VGSSKLMTHASKRFFGLLLIRQILGLQSKSNGRAEALIYFYMIQRGLQPFKAARILYQQCDSSSPPDGRL